MKILNKNFLLLLCTFSFIISFVYNSQDVYAEDSPTKCYTTKCCGTKCLEMGRCSRCIFEYYGTCYSREWWDCCKRSGCNACTIEIPCPCDNSCSGTCTSTCPTGYSKTDPENLCTADTLTATCTYLNDCSHTCTVNEPCYRLETNLAESIPTSLSMIIDGQSYTLSANSSLPTTVKYPSTEDDVQMTLPAVAAKPDVNRGVGYIFRANNYGVDNEWAAWTDCTSPRPEDFCSEGTNNTQDFDPSSLTILQTLKQDAKGQIGGLYYTTNRCDNNRLYSSVLQTYYKVNSNPSIVPPTDDDCDMDPDAVCTIENILPDVGGSDSTNSKGCKSTDYTGKEVNNPLRITLAGDDSNDDNEIKGTVVWFSKSNNTPKLPTIVPEYTYTNTEEMGIMILNDQVYGSNHDNTWALLTNNTLKNSDGNDLARVLDISKNSENGKVTFDFKVEFLSNTVTNPEGIYGFHAVVLDSYMTLDDGTIDQSHMYRFFNWGIDMEDPNVENFEENVLSPTTLTLSWDIDGTKSNVIDLIINAYRIEPTENGIVGSISMTDPDKGEIQLSEFDNPTSDDIGRYADTNTWQFNDLVVSNPYSDEGIVDIGVNELGAIAMYATAFDQACNYSSNSFNVNLNPWFATQGGTVYSSGYAGIGAKQTLEGINISLKLPIDKGTELVTSKHQVMDNLLNPELGAVRAVNVYDSNEKKNFWYDYFTRKLEEQRDSLVTIVNIADCNEGESCLLESETSITIQEDSVCNGKILVKSNDNISITPNITSSSNTSGCIFLAKGDIYIKGGDYLSSGSEVEYDFMDGFFIAEGKVEIEYVDQSRLIRDGLEINGGLVALGKDLDGSTAVDIRRDLRLYNYSHPTVVVASDLKYMRISKTFFGTEAPMYKQEIGFKGL